MLALSVVVAAAMASSPLGADDEAGATLVAGETTFHVESSIPLGRAPHGMCFGAGGRLAYIVNEGDSTISVIDTTTGELVRSLDGGKGPLDVFLTSAGRELIATQFEGDSLVITPTDGSAKARTLVTLADGPSLFNPSAVRGRRWVVCERADKVFEVDKAGGVTRSWATGDRPYPADATPDAIVVFVPDRDADAVTVIDTLNDRVIGQTPVASKPEGGAMTLDGVSYVVACGGSDEIEYINTASYKVVTRISDGIGPRPFSVAMTLDGRFGVINNAGGNTVSILDVASRRIVGRLKVGDKPIVIRMHPDGERIFVSCEDSDSVSVIRMTRRQAPPPADAKTEVVVMGMIHGGHLTSSRYGIDTIKELVRVIKPDFICTEIPPNRFDEAMRGFRQDGKVTESRVSRFPEYVEAIFPLLNEMEYQIVPAAGWTKEMSDFRQSKLEEFEHDPVRSPEWRAQDEAWKAMERRIKEMDGDDNPRVIHTDAYDELIAQGLAPYNKFFNDDLADGGWDNINAKHYALIARQLDRIKGRGKRVLVTFGSAHKYWILDQLKRRRDVKLLDVGSFLDEVDRRRE